MLLAFLSSTIGYDPAGHRMQAAADEALAFGEYVPRGQGTHALEEEELARAENVPGGHPVHTAAPPSASAAAAAAAGGNGVTAAGALQSVVNQLQLPAVLRQAPSDDAADAPARHDACDAEEHQPQFENCVHALQEGGRVS